MKKQLQELGQKRAAAIKEHLVEKFGVDKSRLLVCTTEIETKKSTKPRVEIRM
jgi:outer membrane protein OmpA-like peptidoglycan-associated protein